MTAEVSGKPERAEGRLPEGEELQQNVATRRTIGKIWHGVFVAATVFGIIVLVILMLTIIDEAFGMVAVQPQIDPATLADGRPIEELSKPQLIDVIEANVNNRVMRSLERAGPLAERSPNELREIIEEEILNIEVVESWPLHAVLFNRGEIQQTITEEYERAELRFTSWIDWDFLSDSMSSIPANAGIRTALLGSLWIILVTLVVAVPVGIGASIYLEEYAGDNWLNRIIQTNINNLAGVPSIVYGILGLAVFVRVLAPITSGAFLTGADVDSPNGRTILSAGITLALLILPIIIISGQEAIRAVPNSLRQASYGLGATQWQTIWNHVLPNAIPGILTGTILAMSRALGETAPLIVVGAATFLPNNPDGPFSSFTALPIVIFDWTSRPQDQYRDIAAAGIIVLLVVLLSMNATAILLRNRFSKKMG
jgi:phosphate transport system permease protein